MKIHIEATALKSGLERVKSIVQRTGTIPILSNILMRASNGNLTLCATDLDNEISLTIADVRVENPGQITVQGHTLADAVRKLPDGAEVAIELEAGFARCTAGKRIKFEVPTLPASDFPILNPADPSYTITMMASELKTAFELGSYCAGTEETRHYLLGTHLITHEDGVHFVTTDGHRLSLYKLAKVDFDAGDKLPPMIVPTRAVNEIIKILATAKETDTVVLMGDHARIMVQMGNATFVSKLLDATYPDYMRVIPKVNDLVALIDRKALYAALDRVATFSKSFKSKLKGGGSSRACVMTLRPDELHITAGQSGDVSGRGEELLHIGYDGPEFRMGVNANYLMAHLAAISTNDVNVVFSEDDALSAKDSGRSISAPVLIKAIPEGPHFGLVMPLKA